jgi:hypothetical protein
MEMYRRHIWPQASLPGSHRGEIPHFYTLQRGTPTSTASTKTTKALEEQSSLARRDTTTWLTSTGRSQGSITGALFGPSVVPIGELRQSHTWTVTGTIRSQSWHQYWINDKFIEVKPRDDIHGSTRAPARSRALQPLERLGITVPQYPIRWDYSSIILSAWRDGVNRISLQ